MRSFLLVLIILQLHIPDMVGQEWQVPEDKKGKLSTFPFDDNSRKAGEKLYSIYCLSCHGTPGKANYQKLVPPPGDPATEKIQRNNDGEIFYKVATGRGPMPSFKNILTSEEIWNLISFLRSFNNSYKQKIMPLITSSAYPGAVIKITLTSDATTSAVVLKASAIKDNYVVPVTGAEVKLFVHRTFGLLPVDEAKTTDDGGVALFKVPTNFPGDTAGNILVSARFINEDVFGSVNIDTVLSMGAKNIPVSLVAKRAMWNTVRKAPLWIILTFSLGLLAAWGFIFYVLMSLRDIFIIGDSVINIIVKTEN